jgi:hypothetical protein
MYFIGSSFVESSLTRRTGSGEIDSAAQIREKGAEKRFGAEMQARPHSRRGPGRAAD